MLTGGVKVKLPQEIDERYRLPQQYEALRRCAGPDVRRFLKLLGYRGSNYNNFYKYMEPHGGPTDSGLAGPGDQLNKYMRTAILDGRDAADAYAPLYHLAFHNDHACFPLPKVDADKGLQGLTREYIETQKEFADVTLHFSKRIARDNRVSPDDAKAMTREIREAISQLLVLNQAIQEAIE